MRRFAALLMFAAIAPCLARAQSLQVEGADRALKISVDGKPTGQLTLPANPRQVLVQGTLAYLAMGPAGLWVIDLSHPDSPVVLSRLAEGHDVTGVLTGPDHTVLAVEASWSVVPYDVTNPAAPSITSLSPSTNAAPIVAATPTEASPPPKRVEPTPITAAPPLLPSGTVLRVVQGSVVLNKGLADGLTVGTHVEVFSQALVERPNATTGEIEQTASNESMAVLSIKSVQEHGAVADLNRGDVVRVGDQFVATTAPITERLIWGRPQDFHHRFSAVVRPVLEVGVLGVGSISEFHYSHRFDVPLTLEVQVAPLAFELRNGTGTRAFPTELGVIAYYDTDYFAVGLGAGAMFYSELPVVSQPLTGVTSITTGIAARGTMYLNARLGSIDGLSVQVSNALVIREDVAGQAATFHYGGTQVAGFIPLNRQLTLQLGGGGGENGFAFGEVGIRTYFRGTGGVGTIIVPLCLGGAAFIGATDSVTGLGTTRGGPLASIGVELRL